MHFICHTLSLLPDWHKKRAEFGVDFQKNLVLHHAAYAAKRFATTMTRLEWKLLFMLLGGILALSSCRKGGSESGGIDEVAPGPNASIIRNPVTARQPIDSSQVAKMVFDSERYDFGEVKEGTLVEHTFTFTNAGKVPLIISDARSTCGCTVPEWPEEPVPPGEQGRIRVRFNTENKINQQSKPVTIRANTLPAQTRIYVQGFVVADE